MAAQSDDNIISIINSNYYDLTSAEKRISDYISSHAAAAQSLSISELACETGVAEATISRFSKRLGYDGFSGMKLAIARSVSAGGDSYSSVLGDVTEKDSFEDVCKKVCATDIRAITDTFSLINERDIKTAADMIEKASVIISMGQGGSMVLAEEAAHLFATAGCNIYAVSDSHTQAIRAATIKKGGVVMFFSYSGATIEAMQTLKTAKSSGAGIILITRYPNSPAAELADVVLLCGSNESPLQLGSAAAKIAQIFLMDILFSELCMRNLSACRQVREKIADTLADKHV